MDLDLELADVSPPLSIIVDYENCIVVRYNNTIIVFLFEESGINFWRA